MVAPKSDMYKCDHQQDFTNEQDPEKKRLIDLEHKGLCMNKPGALSILLDDELYEKYLES